MRIWIQRPNEKKRAIEIQPTSSSEEVHELVRKAFQIEEKKEQEPKFVFYGHILTGPTPFRSIKQDSLILFYTVPKPVPPQEFDEYGDYDDVDVTEEEEVDEEDNGDIEYLFTPEQVSENLDNGVLAEQIEHFFENMHIPEVLDNQNSIFNMPEDMAIARTTIRENSSNFVPFIRQHLVNPSLCSISEEDAFNNMCTLLDVDPNQEEIEDDEYVMVDEMTARQRSAVDKMCARGIDFKTAVDALRRVDFNIEEAMASLQEFEDVD